MDDTSIVEIQKSKKSVVKKIITVIIISVAILLPTLLAIFIGKYIDKNRDISEFENIEVILYNTNGNLLFSEKGVDEESTDSSLVKIFSAITSNILPSDDDPDLSKYGDPIIAHIKEDSSLLTLTCYFSMEDEESYCTDNSGQLYLIPSMYCDYFVNSHFAESLYKTASPPALTTGDGEQIIPYAATWNYLNASGDFLNATLFEATDQRSSFTMTGGISLDFSVEPDECTVSVLDGDNLIFSGTLDELKTASLSESSRLTLSMHAVWQKQNSRSYYGEQRFEFQVSVKNKAEFFVDTLNISADQLILISVTNVSDLSKLSFTSQFTENIPTFQKKDEIAYALIAAPDLDVGDNFSFTVAYGITSKDFTVSMSDPLNEVFANTSSALSINFKNASSISNKYIFLGTPLADVDQKYFVKGTAYGSTVSQFGKTFVSPFAEYRCSDAAISVRSLNSGLVVFTGESETLGKHIIIDLGLELKIWYCYLDEIYVSAGDHVATGDVLGTVGTLVLSSDLSQGFSTMFTYREYVVSPDCIVAKSTLYS